MHEAVASPLEAWGNFYVIVGSSARALTGLQFVVMTLIAQVGRARNRGETVSAFGTPNVVHFCAALLVAGAVLGRDSSDALFVIAGAVLLLVFVGIHNAWDTVTYVTVVQGAGAPEAELCARRGQEAGANAEAPRASAPSSSPIPAAAGSAGPPGPTAKKPP